LQFKNLRHTPLRSSDNPASEYIGIETLWYLLSQNEVIICLAGKDPMIKELTFIKKMKVEWREKAAPAIRHPGDAIIRPFVVSRCDGDSIFLFHNFSKAMRLGVNLHYLDRKVLDVFGSIPFSPSFCVGHECIGEVVETGEGVQHFRKGQVVVVPWAVSCGTCAVCNSGLFSNCSVTTANHPVSAYGFGESTGGWGGTVCDLLRVPYADKMLIDLPADVNPLHCSSLSDNIADAYRAVGPQLRKYPNARVLIMGGAARSIGLYAAALAVALGASGVDYVDTSETRLGIAAKVGAHPIKLDKNMSLKKLATALPREGYPITVDASGSADKLNFAIRSLTAGGTCTGTAFYMKKETPLPLWDMYLKSANVHIGLSHPRRDIAEIIPLIQSRKFKPEQVTTLNANWADATEAYVEPTTKLVLSRPRIMN
jgi:threonine dehydrogenase-like Zn-dependent dehydrogenase